MNITRLTFSIGVVILFMTSCEFSATQETTVNPDGSLEKVIALDPKQTLFDISEGNGWTREDTIILNDSVKDKQSRRTTFKKHFDSVDELNKDLDKDIDTLMRIHSTFEKQFRWFYTYIMYTETYRPINTLPQPVSEFITPEDLAFIDRLPAEGKKITKADSVFLSDLNEKITDGYLTQALFDEYFEILMTLLKNQNIDKSWQDTLTTNREQILKQLISKDGEPEDMLQILDTLKIPFDHARANAEFKNLSKPLERRVGFYAVVNAGKYTNVIHMPWDVINHNADSIDGNTLTWKPPVLKFLLKEYSMHATSRKTNYWAFGFTAVLIGFTVFLFVRKKR